MMYSDVDNWEIEDEEVLLQINGKTVDKLSIPSLVEYWLDIHEKETFEPIKEE